MPQLRFPESSKSLCASAWRFHARRFTILAVLWALPLATPQKAAAQVVRVSTVETASHSLLVFERYVERRFEALGYTILESTADASSFWWDLTVAGGDQPNGSHTIAVSIAIGRPGAECEDVSALGAEGCFSSVLNIYILPAVTDLETAARDVAEAFASEIEGLRHRVTQQ